MIKSQLLGKTFAEFLVINSSLKLMINKQTFLLQIRHARAPRPPLFYLFKKAFQHINTGQYFYFSSKQMLFNKFEGGKKPVKGQLVITVSAPQTAVSQLA